MISKYDHLFDNIAIPSLYPPVNQPIPNVLRCSVCHRAMPAGESVHFMFSVKCHASAARRTQQPRFRGFFTAPNGSAYNPALRARAQLSAAMVKRAKEEWDPHPNFTPNPFGIA